MKLALLRHGPTEWNRAGRLQGRTDIPLDEDARQELARYALPPDWRKVSLVSSPLKRATETAEIVAGRAPLAVTALIEMDWGAWEGQQSADLVTGPEARLSPIEEWGWTFCPPDGERLDALRARVLNWADHLTEDTLAVCHIGVMRVLCACATGWDFRGPAPFRIKRRRLYILEKTPNGWVLADVQRLIEKADGPCA